MGGCESCFELKFNVYSLSHWVTMDPRLRGDDKVGHAGMTRRRID